MNSQLRQRAVNLRIREELSYSQIRKRLGIPKSTLSYWLRGFPLTEKRILELRRQGWKKGEAARERFRNTMERKQELECREVYKKYQKRLSKISEDAFFVAGLMLYLGEGDKSHYAQISLSNTDPKIIKFFIKWMIDFLGIAKEDMRVQLHLYENMDIENEKRFWKNELGFSEIQFYKSEVRKLQKSSFSYKESYRHGTCQIYFPGVEKKRELMMAIEAFVDKYMKHKEGA